MKILTAWMDTSVCCRLPRTLGLLGAGSQRGRHPWSVPGYSALLLRDVPFSFFFFGSYQAITSGAAKALGKESKNDLNPVTILASGGLAGATSWAIMFPVDVLKSRMQTASSTGPLSLRGAFRAVYSEFGIHGFYRGWSAAVMRAFPANGSLFLGVEMTHRVFRWYDSRHAAA